MKVGSRCGYCLLHRGYMMIRLSTEDEETRRDAMEALLKLMGDEYGPEAVPSVLGTERGWVIARVTGCDDPYRDQKREANMHALELRLGLREYIDGKPDSERLRAACLISCLGNVVDYDVPGSNSDMDAALELLDEGLYIDDTDELKSLIDEDTRLLFLTDNAGEIAFDTLLVEELRRLGAYVTVAVKDGPIVNDAAMRDAEMVGMTEAADEVITTGMAAMGTWLDRSPGWFMERVNSADVIVAKGMANWETLTEYPAPCPLMYIFRTKCEPAARAVGAPLNRNIALLVEKGWKL